MGISRKIEKMVEEGGWIRRMFETGIALKKEHGDDSVFDLSLGNPVMEPPEEFQRELRRLSKSPSKGMHRYMPNVGYPETREVIASILNEDTGLPFTLNEFVMCCGTAGGLNVVLKTILDPGDEVVVFSPYFVEYLYYIDNHSGVSVIAPTDDEFQPNLDSLESLMTSRTRAVIINSPNNPTGVLYSTELLEQLGDLLDRTQIKFGTEIFLISDEPYRRIIFDGLKYTHIYRYHQQSIAVYSHSKDLGLPGERIGYIAVNPQYHHRKELVDGLAFCNRTLGFVNAPALMQHLVRATQYASVNVSEYQKKRNYLNSQLTEMGYNVIKPQGAFYMFPKSPVDNEVAFVEELQKWNVLVVPGKGFGKPGYFRIAYCVEDEVLKGAMNGFSEAARKFGFT